MTVHLSEGSSVRRFTCPKVHLSEGSSVRRFTCPKVTNNSKIEITIFFIFDNYYFLFQTLFGVNSFEALGDKILSLSSCVPVREVTESLRAKLCQQEKIHFNILCPYILVTSIKFVKSLFQAYVA